ncbi:MAG: CADD family putative folate metabolism protein [Candidatus Aenigmarchaeota archaeon]|nr:CADD family putative folate metabolism protein [Candidatus Aenigmarchaeota archaeon]
MDFLAQVEARIAAKSLLKHPFYKLWSDGKLTIDDLKIYSKQYHKFVAAFPRFVAAVYSNCHDAATRRMILGNLNEEELGDGTPHEELWLEFCQSLGLSRQEVLESGMAPETEQSLKTLDNLSRSGLAEGAAALLAYESQIPDVAKSKLDGLEKFYGIRGKGLEFFTTHMEVDIEHQKVWKAIISKATGKDAAAMQALDKALDAQWQLLDGVMLLCKRAC